MSTQHLKKRSEKLLDLIIVAIILILSFTMILPFLWMVSTSLKPVTEIISISPTFIPENPTFEAYIKAWNRYPFLRFYINSLIVTGICVLTSLIFCTLTGYTLAKYEFKGKNIIFLLILSTMMIPIHMLMIPLYLMASFAGILDSYLALIGPSIMTVFGIFLMREFAKSIPNELIDSARIDGCSELGIFARIILPLLKPAVITLTILTFLHTWDAFLWPLIVTESMDMRVVSIGIASFFGQHDQPMYYNQNMAVAVIGVAPVLIVFVFLQKHFTRSITLTGLKA